MVNKVFEMTRLISEKKDLETILKYMEEETEDCASVYDFDIKNHIPGAVYQYYAMKEEEEIWYILQTWDKYRHTFKGFDYIKLVGLLKQQYLIIIMINSLLKRRIIEKDIKDKFNRFKFVMK